MASPCSPSARAPFIVGGAQLDGFMGILFACLCEVLMILKADTGKRLKTLGVVTLVRGMTVLSVDSSPSWPPL